MHGYLPQMPHNFAQLLSAVELAGRFMTPGLSCKNTSINNTKYNSLTRVHQVFEQHPGSTRLVITLHYSSITVAILRIWHLAVASRT